MAVLGSAAAECCRVALHLPAVPCPAAVPLRASRIWCGAALRVSAGARFVSSEPWRPGRQQKSAAIRQSFGLTEGGEDLSDLAAEDALCRSNVNGGWIFKGRTGRGRVAVHAKIRGGEGGRRGAEDKYPAPKRQQKADTEAELDFDDVTEDEVQTFLDLQLQSESGMPATRHYECVFLIHEDNFEEVPEIIQKVKDKIAEFKGTVWRLNDWGLRRMAYKIKKASKANYVLLNFEVLPAQVNAFEKMLLADERVIRHLVMKKKGPETKDYPPPPEWGDKPDSEDEQDWSDDNEEEDEEEKDDGGDDDGPEWTYQGGEDGDDDDDEGWEEEDEEEEEGEGEGGKDVGEDVKSKGRRDSAPKIKPIATQPTR